MVTCDQWETNVFFTSKREHCSQFPWWGHGSVNTRRKTCKFLLWRRQWDCHRMMNTTHRHATRIQHNIHQMRPNHEHARKCIWYDLPILINNVSIEIKEKVFTDNLHGSAGYIKLKTLDSYQDTSPSSGFYPNTNHLNRWSEYGSKLANTNSRSTMI